MDVKPRFSRTCGECKTPYDGEFKKVLDLQSSGLIVYIHKNDDIKDEKKTCQRKNEYYVLHNTSRKDLKRPDFINELCQFRTKCLRCKTTVQKVRSLLDEISAIRGEEVLGVCGYCKKANPAGKCRRCEYIINKFHNYKAKEDVDRQTNFKSWLERVREFLESFIEEEETCRHKMYREKSATELQNLLEKINLPLIMHKPVKEQYTTTASQIMITQGKEMLEELLFNFKYKGEVRSGRDLNSFQITPKASDSTCICKRLRENNFVIMPPLMESQGKMELMSPKDTDKDEKWVQLENKSGDRKNLKSPLKGKAVPTDGKMQKKISSKETEKTDKENKPPKEPLSLKELKRRKNSLSPENKLILKMIKEREHHRKLSEKPTKKAMPIVLPKFEELPPLKPREVHVLEESSESILECANQKISLPTEMVRGSKLVKYGPRASGGDNSLKPLLFKRHPVCAESPVLETPPPATTPIRLPSSNFMKKSKEKSSAEINTKGLINYELSNHYFIDNGWTKLPSTKIMRKMNIYKMIPTNPKYDWFKINKFKGMKFYDTGETLAEVDMDGCGRWYYKNGAVALDYYNAEDLNAGQRYVVYSSGEEMDSGRLKPYTVLASFDYLGNGVVYDHYGNIRLKYNQSEGVVIDSKVGPPGRWKWHTLNDPPILQPVFIDTEERHPSPRIQELMRAQKDDVTPPKVIDQNMMSIELDNLLKEKAAKLLQKYKPFQIRAKVLKLNEKFSLRILDQANIYILFRDGPIALKLNLGMLLLNDEIIDIQATDVREVATPYDRHPLRARSPADIQS